MGRFARAACALVALVALVTPPRAAFAEASASDVALAEALFQEGQKLMKERRYAEACPKFQESQRLDPGGGTLFQLATCHEFTGRTASAWAEFSEVALLAKQRNRPDIERAARERVHALEPRLSWLVISVPEAARLEGLSVERDGTALGPGSFGTAMPADPGKHTVAAKAPGHRAWSTTVEVGPESDRKTVTLPKLGALPRRSVPPPVAGSSEPPSETPPPRARHSPALLYAAAGVGIAGLGTAAFFGIRSYSKEQEANEKCPSADCNDPSGVEASKSAVSSANIANVAGAFGLVGAGVFTYLVLTNSPREGERRTAVRVSPQAAPGVLALGVDGRF
jgi:hypothetical protein